MASAQQPLRRTAYSPMFVTNRERNYQLPALNIPSHSIASGTDIPEPAATPPAEPHADPEMQDGHHAIHTTGQSNKAVNRNGLSLTGIDGTSEAASSQPQTPRPLDSPNPLRSHPTSTHSLSRQFQLDGQQQQGNSSPNGSAAALTQAHHNGRSPSPGPAYGLAPTQSYGSHKRPHTQGSSMNAAGAPPHKRQHTNESMESANAPPTKRPMSVRKFLGLRALSNAFGRSDSKKRDDGAGGGGGGGVYATHTGHARNKSADKLSLFSLSLSARRPESRLGLMSSHGKTSSERPESRAPTERTGPTLSRRRSSLMLLRGAFGLGTNADDTPHDDAARHEQHALEQQYEREQEERKDDDGDNSTEEPDVSMRDAPPPQPLVPSRTPTPPPTLPGLNDLKATKGLHEAGDGGAFFGDEDMFKDIQ